MSTEFSFPAEHINRIVVVVILKVTKYSVVPLVNSHWTSNALHYHIPQGTNNMNILSLSLIWLKMILVNITVIFVKKNETQSIGSTTVKIAVILLMLYVFLVNTQKCQLWRVLTHLIVTHTSLLSLRKLKTALNVTNVAILAMRFSFNVPGVISTCTFIVYIKDKCGLGLRMSSLL